MEKETNQEQDQAAQLKRLFDEVEQNDPGTTNQQNEILGNREQVRQIDVLNLPPRKEVHGKNKKRVHFKLGRPLMRFLMVILILLIVLFGAYYLWGEELITYLNNL